MDLFGIGNIFGSLINTVGSAISTSQTNKANKDEAAKARAFQTSERIASQNWAVEQWNREQDYNSPQAARARLEAAGFSPMAYLEGQGGTTQAPAAPSDPSTSMPTMQNPWEGVGAGIQNAIGNYLAYSKLNLEQQKVENDTTRAESDRIYKEALAKTEDAKREGIVEFMGTQIQLNRGLLDKNDAEIHHLMQTIVESQKRVEQMAQFIKASQIDVSLKSWELFAAKRRLPYELKQLGVNLIGTQLDNDMRKQQKGMNKSYIEGGYYDAELQYNKNKSYYNTRMLYNSLNYQEKYDDSFYAFRNREAEARADDAQGHVKSRYLNVLDKSFDSIGNIFQSFVPAFQSFMFWQAGRTNNMRAKQMQESTANPPVGNTTIPFQNQGIFY